MYIYKSLQRPVLVFGVPFKAFYAITFMTFGIFMGTLNILVLLLALGLYLVIRTMTTRDYYFFEILKRSWGYSRKIK